MTCICHFIFFVSFPESPVGISDVGSFPVWSGWSLIICQLFRCRNLVINRMFSYIRGRHGGCQLRGHPYAPIHLYTSCTFIHTLYVCMPHTSVFPIPLYICMFFYVPHMSWGLGGICTPHVSWGLLGVSVHLTGISVSVSTSICLSVHNSHASCSPSLWVASLLDWMPMAVCYVMPSFLSL